MSSGGTKIYKSFSEFWPYYVREHANGPNRYLHFVGTAIVIALFFAALSTRRWGLIVLMPLAGYGFAWFGHFFLQRNKPATFTYPRWSLMADFKMFALMLVGRMGKEIEAAKQQP